MDVTVKREHIEDPLHTYLPVEHLVKPYLPHHEEIEHLDQKGCIIQLEQKGCIIHPDLREDDQELHRLNQAIALEDSQAQGSSEDGSPGRLSQSDKGRRYRNETEEGRKARLARDAERRRQSRKLESEQDAASRRAKQAAARRYYLQYLETDEDRKRRREQNAQHKRLRRQQMSAEEREDLKRKESARRAEKRKEAQEKKRIKHEPVSPGNMTGIPQDPLLLPTQDIDVKPIIDTVGGVMPPHILPIDMKPLLTHMGFPTGLAPFQMDPRSSYNHGYGY